MDISAICLCACVTLSLQNSIQRTAPLPGCPTHYTFIETPLLPASNKHTHVHIAPTPRGTAGVSSRGLWHGGKMLSGGQSSASLLL